MPDRARLQQGGRSGARARGAPAGAARGPPAKEAMRRARAPSAAEGSPSEPTRWLTSNWWSTHWATAMRSRSSAAATRPNAASMWSSTTSAGMSTNVVANSAARCWKAASGVTALHVSPPRSGRAGRSSLPSSVVIRCGPSFENRSPWLCQSGLAASTERMAGPGRRASAAGREEYSPKFGGDLGERRVSHHMSRRPAVAATDLIPVRLATARDIIRYCAQLGTCRALSGNWHVGCSGSLRRI